MMRLFLHLVKTAILNYSRWPFWPQEVRYVSPNLLTGRKSLSLFFFFFNLRGKKGKRENNQEEKNKLAIVVTLRENLLHLSQYARIPTQGIRRQIASHNRIAWTKGHASWLTYKPSGEYPAQIRVLDTSILRAAHEPLVECLDAYP